MMGLSKNQKQGGRSMTSIPESCAPVNARALFEAAIDEAVETLCQSIGARLNELLVAVVSHVVGRPHHVRRRKVSTRLRREGKCCRCGSRQSRRFSRNGRRKRQPLQTIWGEVPLELPRVRCECGGSVKIDWDDLLRPYQRIGDDVDAQIQRWGGMAVSLRQMRREMEHLHFGPLSLRTMNKRLHQLITLDPNREAEDVPPILQIDATWVTIVRANGEVRRDRKGRKRAAKGRFKVPIMVAMGVWPDSNRCEILLWRLGESESAEEWVKFLEILEAEGICGQNGLKLIIHDGGKGLCSALKTVWFDAQQQRCLFHKFRNIYKAIHPPKDLSDKQACRRRKKIFKDFQAIWEAHRYETMLRRYLKVYRTYRHSQPEAVATLRRDFRLTVTYYALEKEFPSWERQHLRTTSRLERFNRRLRHRIRAANAYHSNIGAKAMVTQEVRGFHDAQRQR
jgi:putative transposase